MEKKKQSSPASVFKAGAVAFAFLIIGYEVALFVHKAAVERVESVRDRPDTVFVVDSSLAARLLGGQAGEQADFDRNSGMTCSGSAAGNPGRETRHSGDVVIRKPAEHSEVVEKVRRETRKVESFRFNPNTVSPDELQRLGFSEKQAQSIINYRSKGGRFRRKSDFAKSYVVADSVYRRLEPFIDIPRIDINLADSASFDSLPGIGGYFASKMVSYRESLGGYSFPEQLMDIWHFDREKYDGLSDLIVCSPPRDSFALWTLPVEELRKHPYIRSYQAARSIALYRDNTPKSRWCVEDIASAGILPEEDAAKLARCAISLRY